MAGGFSDYVENMLIDAIFRGQTFTAPVALYAALFTAAGTDAGGGTEVSGGSYARVLIPKTLAGWAGTQSAGSTTASTGTGGATSNNGTITFPTPSAAWGAITHFAILDAASGGNLIVPTTALTQPKTVNNGDPAPSFGIGTLTFSLD
jgi:hypothetical protein